MNAPKRPAGQPRSLRSSSSASQAKPNASITAKALTITGATATERAYDGTTGITVSGGSLNGVVDGDSVIVKREIDGGLETVKLSLPAIVTTDLRLNEPRYASLPNIMKAKKKPLDEKTAADYGVDVTPRLTVVETKEPGARSAGILVGSVDELVAKLKEAGAV